MNSKFTPEHCSRVNALRAYERAHKVRMNTPVWAANISTVRHELEMTRIEYIEAVNRHSPNTIVM